MCTHFHITFFCLVGDGGHEGVVKVMVTLLSHRGSMSLFIEYLKLLKRCSKESGNSYGKGHCGKATKKHVLICKETLSWGQKYKNDNEAA